MADRKVMHGGETVIQPACEPNPSLLVPLGPIAAFLYLRWSTWAIGVDFLGAGFAIVVGPLMFGICHRKRQLAHFAAREEAYR